MDLSRQSCRLRHALLTRGGEGGGDGRGGGGGDCSIERWQKQTTSGVRVGQGKPALTTAFGCATSSQGAALHSPARARAAEVGWEAWAGGTEAWEETAHMARLLGRLHTDGSGLGWLHANKK